MPAIENKIAAALAGLALICSCSVLRPYETPGEFVQQIPADSTDWKSIFTDPCLHTLIETGLENNTDIRKAEAAVSASKAALTAAHLAPLPSFALTPAATLSGYSVPLSLNWEIGASIPPMTDYAKADKLQSEENLRRARLEMVCAIAADYYTLLKLDAQLLVSRTTATSWKENVRIMKEMKSAGMTNEASVSQTEANACSIAASIPDLELQISKLENEIARIIGVEPFEIKRSSLNEALVECKAPDSINLAVLAKRPDVRAAELALRKACDEKARAKAALYPSISLSGSYGWQKALQSPAGILTQLGATLTQPIFKRGQLVSSLRAAQARQIQAAEDFRGTLLLAGNQVNDALNEISAAKSKTDSRKLQIEALEKAETSTRLLMRHSESTYLEVLTAQQSLLSARLLQISDTYDAIIGTINLYKSLGGNILY